MAKTLQDTRENELCKQRSNIEVASTPEATMQIQRDHIIVI